MKIVGLMSDGKLLNFSFSKQNAIEVTGQISKIFLKSLIKIVSILTIMGKPRKSMLIFLRDSLFMSEGGPIFEFEPHHFGTTFTLDLKDL